MIEARTAPDMAAIMRLIPGASMPLALLVLIWLAFGRTPRRESERFARAVTELKAESIALESVLGIVATRLAENNSRMRDEAERLMTLGDEAADRLGRVVHYLSREGAKLERGSSALESAAAAAKVDIGVLLHDLPKAEEQARTISGTMKEAGLSAHAQAGALEAQLAAITARGREADEIVGGAAQRLASNLAQIESSSAAAASGLGEAASGMSSLVDGAMARATEALAATRAGLDAQGAASQALVDRLGEQIEGLRLGLDVMGPKGEAVAASFESARASNEAMAAQLSGGTGNADALIARVDTLSESLGGLFGRLDGDLPSALARIEEQAARAGEISGALAPLIASLEASASAAAARCEAGESSIHRQNEAIDHLLVRLQAGTTDAETQLVRIGEAARGAEDAASRIIADTAPGLLDALVRVRQAASQAAERARAAIAEVIPESADALAEAGHKALGAAMAGTVDMQMAELSRQAEAAAEVARAAGERLTRQMLALGDSVARIEARIEEARNEEQARENDGFSRRVALLIESLNSTAIDVTKILSNEVTDSSWAAYLKGDRGVFTRRAVRLLDASQAREVARHYEEEPEFREQVNRYIHDFEAMLRRVLADRDGAPLGVTLLSSDMGKLYVALAQGIERLRT